MDWIYSILNLNEKSKRQNCYLIKLLAGFLSLWFLQVISLFSFYQYSEDVLLGVKQVEKLMKIWNKSCPIYRKNFRLVRTDMGEKLESSLKQNAEMLWEEKTESLPDLCLRGFAIIYIGSLEQDSSDCAIF